MDQEPKKYKKQSESETKKMNKKIPAEKQGIMELRKAEAEMIEKEYKSNLKEYMEQRLYDFKYKLRRSTDDGYGLSVMKIDSLIRGKNLVGNVSYSTEELAMAFEYYRQFIEEINKVKRYIPSKKNFCAFLSISSSTYDTYMTCGDQAKMETMKIIDDYITDISYNLRRCGQFFQKPSEFRTHLYVFFIGYVHSLDLP